MSGESTPLRYYLDVLRRRKWLVLPLVVLTPVIATAITMQKPAVYRASAQVLLSRQNLAAALTGVPDTTSLQDPQRFGQTQAELARVPIIASRVLAAAGIRNQSAGWFLGSSAVSPEPNADLLTFSVSTGSPKLAQRLATEYGRQFVRYRQQLDTGYLKSTQTEVKSRLAELRAAGGGSSPLATSLDARAAQIGTLLALGTPGAALVHPADGAEQTEPRPTRNGLLGLGLGLVLGFALAFFAEAIDTRVSNDEQIAEGIDQPLLARIPPARRTSDRRPSMLSDPYGPQAEAFRMLRNNLEFVNLDVAARAIMITSALPGEGKTTTAANLALALSVTGKHVVLCDLDARNPRLAEVFGVQDSSGLVDVVVNRARLDDALVPVPVPFSSGFEQVATAATNGHRRLDAPGRIELMPFGPPVPNPGEFIGTHAVAVVLQELRERADVVIVDSPPLLPVGDALLLSARVDALIVVARVDMIRRPMLHELRRLLDTSSAPKLGFVATGTQPGGVAYGYGSYGHTPPLPKHEETVA